jgi:hypothetical protein
LEEVKLMDDILGKFAREAEQAFSGGVNFSDKGKLAIASKRVYQELDRFRIGPRALSLLVAFAFEEKNREKIWKELERAVRDNK